MSRQDTFIGLSPAALKIVEGCGKLHLTGKVEKVEVVISSTDCRYTIFKDFPISESCVKVEEGIFKAEGMFNTKYPLSKYTLRDGTVLFEVSQTSIWDSGPWIYTCLGDAVGVHLNKSEWTKEELESHHPGDFYPSEVEQEALLKDY